MAIIGTHDCLVSAARNFLAIGTAKPEANE
jgi:hypothetical protein